MLISRFSILICRVSTVIFGYIRDFIRIIIIIIYLYLKEALLGAFGSIMGDFMAYSLDKLAVCAFFAIIVTQQIIYGKN